MTDAPLLRTTLRLTVNGSEHVVETAPEASLASVLRNNLGLTGTKIGCSDGQCGSCTVLVDDRAVRACVYPARKAVGKHVLTIEGLAATAGPAAGSPDCRGHFADLHPLQRAFIEHGAVQCGFCTPGALMAAAALWMRMLATSRVPEEGDIARALGRNACRCTGYASILRAVRSAISEHVTGQPLPPAVAPPLRQHWGTSPHAFRGADEPPDAKTQDATTLFCEPLRVIGHSYPRPDAVDKVTGAALFADDYSFPGMLFGATLRAAHPHARILSIDTSHAAAMTGVHAVLTHRNVAGRNRHGLVIHDWPVLCDDKVRYLGDAVAIVAADTPEIAAAALEHIRVEYEPLSVVASAEQARRPEAATVHDEWPTGNLLEHIKVRHGDVERGFAEADVIVEREYRTPAYDHMFMEPECSIGVPAGYDAAHTKLTVHVGSQIPYADRAQIAAALQMGPEEVRVKGTLIGGGFGGKEDIMGQIHAALLARTTGRPVKILYDRSESMLAHPKRHATVIRIKTGARRDGTLTAVEAELTGDAGAYASLSAKVLTRATTHATGPYQVPNARIDCYAMYTNNPPAGAFRGFGVTQSAFAVESNMDILAEELGIDPYELRRRNAMRVGSTTPTGQVLRESVGLLECLDWVEARVKYYESAPPPAAIPASSRLAWGLAVAYKNTGLGGGADDAAGAEVEVFADGTAEARASSADLGQGLTTVVAQCTAEELGLPFERVRVLLSDTDLCPDGGPTTASRQTYITGNAVRLAAQGLRTRMAAVAAERWDVAPDSITFEAGLVRSGTHTAPFGEVVQWLIDEGHAPRLTYRYSAPRTQPLGTGGNMHFAFGFAAQAAQVAVNEKTGEVKVLRVVTAADGGRALNPLSFRGQVEGGIAMGIGTALTEEYVVRDGVPQTRRWADYGVPLLDDVPEMDIQIIEHLTADGPYGAKGVGELPSIPTAPAICNAIYRAVGARLYQLPARPDGIRAHLPTTQ